jgi:hypothetical protein
MDITAPQALSEGFSYEQTAWRASDRRYRCSELARKTALTTTNRGVISIVDRKGLKQAVNGANGISECEFNRVLGVA